MFSYSKDVFDNTMPKQAAITQKKHAPSYKHLLVKMNRTEEGMFYTTNVLQNTGIAYLLSHPIFADYLLSLMCCVIYFVYLCSVSCPILSVSRLSILDCPFG